MWASMWERQKKTKQLNILKCYVKMLPTLFQQAHIVLFTQYVRIHILQIVASVQQRLR